MHLEGNVKAPRPLSRAPKALTLLKFEPLALGGIDNDFWQILTSVEVYNLRI
jgi:hypothetical protein